MKGIVLILLTILVALYMINECEGRRRRRYRYYRRGLTIQGRSKSLPLNTGDKRETMNDMQGMFTVNALVHKYVSTERI